MKRPPSSPRPVLIWQTVMILLPVAVLTMVGLVYLRREQALAEQETRQRAEETVQQLAADLGQGVAAELAEFELIGQRWWACYSGVSWPGSRLDKQYQKQRINYQKRMADWGRKYPGLDLKELLPNRCVFSVSGQLVFPADFAPAPRPPEWVHEMSADQMGRLAAARQMELTGTEPKTLAAAWEAFLETQPPTNACLNAHLALLCLQWRTNTAGGAALPLLRFIQNHGAVLSEDGLPLSARAYVELLRQARASNFDEACFGCLRHQVLTAPSPATARFLEEAERLVAEDPLGVRAAVRALRSCWEVQERLRYLARQLQQSRVVNPLSTSNVWLDTPPGLFLAVLNPAEIQSPAVTNNRTVIHTNPVTQARFYSKNILDRVFEYRLRTSPIKLPSYYAVSAELEGAALGMPFLSPDWSSSSRPPETPAQRPRRVAPPEGRALLVNKPDDTLALARGVLSHPAVMIAEIRPNAPPGTGGEYESLPSHPIFTLRLHLAEPRLLYARQKERTLWLGTLIVASAAAALIGLWAAWKSVHRQQQLLELKSNFVSSVSHELRTPIASVRLMVEGLERGKFPEPAKQREYFRLILRECGRLSALVENVLDFSRIERGRKQYEFEPTDLMALVQHTVKLMESPAAERQVALSTKLDGPRLASLNPPPHLDGRAIQQALVNLLDNAIKHAPANSTVTVELGWAPGATAAATNAVQAAPHVLLSVSDQGPGIPRAEHEHIFERFYRLGSELRRETPGVGIGLSIVKHIVTAHGGWVTVQSEPGQGSRFTLHLPLNGPGPAGWERQRL